MADLVKYFFGTESQILALTPTDTRWVNLGFYYPSDKTYFYQAVNGVMRKYGDGASSSIGITLNDHYIAGFKTFIQSTDYLYIPSQWEYSPHILNVDGVIDIDLFGSITI